MASIPTPPPSDGDKAANASQIHPGKTSEESSGAQPVGNHQGTENTRTNGTSKNDASLEATPDLNGVETLKAKEEGESNGNESGVIQAEDPKATLQKHQGRLDSLIPSDSPKDQKSNSKSKESADDGAWESNSEGNYSNIESYEYKGTLRTKKDKAPRRIKQFSQYLRMMEDRMAYLEDTIEKMKPSEAPWLSSGESHPADLYGMPPPPAPADPFAPAPPLDYPAPAEAETYKVKGPICDIRAGDTEFFMREVNVPIWNQATDKAAATKAPNSLEKMEEDKVGLDLVQTYPDTWVIEVLLGATKTAAPQEDESLKDQEMKTPIQSKLPEIPRGRPERVRIRSQPLLSYLSEFGGCDAYAYTLVFLSPFKLFMKHEARLRSRLKELEEAKQNEPEAQSAEIKEVEETVYGNSDSDLLPHLRLLIQLLDTYLKPTLQRYNSLTCKKATHIAFEHLYYLFQYHQEIMCPDGSYQLYRVYGFAGGRERLLTPKDESPKPVTFVVDCYQYASNGHTYGPVPHQFTIRKYSGYREITSLPVFPLDFHPDADNIRKRLKERGDKYIELNVKDDIIHRQYTGVSLGDQPEEIDSQVIIDQKLAIFQNRVERPEFGIRNMTVQNEDECREKCTCSDPMCTLTSAKNYHQDIDEDKQQISEYFTKNKQNLQPPDDLTKPPEEELILLPNFVYGFALRSRKWAKLNLDNITEIEYKNSFDRLVLPPGHAETVKALVEDHSRGPKSEHNKDNIEVAMDLVRGKGKGLIILLHGEPGVGKTSTAECIADFTQRPLYPVTCGDIGSVADKVEENLEKTFQLAHKWGCVLLLDEADVFLKERNRTDIERNAIVSVFLRSMEYYSGILFLTTNRVGTLDPAFRSRIHLSLYYPPLDADATEQIWKMHIDTATALFKDNQAKILIKDDDILRFARDHYKKLQKKGQNSWNGRQIRNAFQTAIALAKMAAKENGGMIVLKGDEFKRVAKTSQAFDDYLLLTKGGTESNLARQTKIRNDRFRDDEDSDRPRAKAKPRRKKDVTSEGTSGSSASGSDSESDAKKDRKKERSSHGGKSKKKDKEEFSEKESRAAEKSKKDKDRKKKRRNDDSG